MSFWEQDCSKNDWGSPSIKEPIKDSKRRFGGLSCIGRGNPIECESIPKYVDDGVRLFHKNEEKVLWKSLSNELRDCITSNGLQHSFYPDPVAVDLLAHRISENFDVESIMTEFEVNYKIAISFVRLALYDVKLIADDSGSMDDDRIAELKEHAQKLISLSARFDTDGMDLIMMNYCRPGGNNVINFKGQNAGTQFDDFWKQFPEECNSRQYYLTPTAKLINDYVIQPLFEKPKAIFNKPVLVYTLTDGVPNHGFGGISGAKLLVENVLLNAYYLKKKHGMPQTAIEFTFGHIGNDKAAGDWLNDLDNYPYIDMNVDVVSSFEIESSQISLAGKITEFTIGLWFAKFALGAIDDNYDLMDELESIWDKLAKDPTQLPLYSEVPDKNSDPKMKEADYVEAHLSKRLTCLQCIEHLRNCLS
eukprot:NODE_194_length_13294_cov_0.803714.p4 type:complete len:419 gc:universal NODE_194_length_13294_cov_0.803714:3141-4397(+)